MNDKSDSVISKRNTYLSFGLVVSIIAATAWTSAKMQEIEDASLVVSRDMVVLSKNVKELQETMSDTTRALDVLSARIENIPSVSDVVRLQSELEQLRKEVDELKRKN